MNKLLLILMCCMVFSGCEGLKNEFRSWGTANEKGDYEIKNSYIGSETETDGWYFFADGKIIRISGDVETLGID